MTASLNPFKMLCLRGCTTNADENQNDDGHHKNEHHFKMNVTSGLIFICVTGTPPASRIALIAYALVILCALGVVMLEVLGLAVGMAGTLVCFPTLLDLEMN